MYNGMTLKTFKNLMEKYNIPEDVEIKSDSGWECDSTPVGGIYFSEEKSILMLTQSINKFEKYHKDGKYIPLI